MEIVVLFSQTYFGGFCLGGFGVGVFVQGASVRDLCPRTETNMSFLSLCITRPGKGKIAKDHGKKLRSKLLANRRLRRRWRTRAGLTLM